MDTDTQSASAANGERRETFPSREIERALNVAGSGRNRGRRRFAREHQRRPWSSKWGPRLQGLFV